MEKTPMNIIQWEGDSNNNVLVYKSEITDFNTGSVLVVDESQEALVYQNGIAEKYGRGKHVLPTLNVPVARGFWANFFSKRKDSQKDGSTPYKCDVYFINTVADLSLVWGTPSRITLEDPKYKILVNVGANGTTKVRIKDSMRFVIGVCGQLKEYSFERLKSTVKNDLIQIVTSLISREICSSGVSILEINQRLPELSDSMLKSLNAKLDDLGIEATHFNINIIEAEAGDLENLRKRKEKWQDEMQAIDVEFIKTTRLAEAQAQARRVQGYTYQDERRFDVLEGAAKNEGSSGTVMGATMGLGMGVGMGTGFASATREAAAALDGDTVICPKCKAEVKNGKFCPNCGASLEKPKNICANCGAEIAAGARFCGNCGAAVKTARVCSNCKTEVADGVNFCPNCGKKID